jgi:hypothetical protein
MLTKSPGANATNAVIICSKRLGGNRLATATKNTIAGTSASRN